MNETVSQWLGLVKRPHAKHASMASSVSVSSQLVTDTHTKPQGLRRSLPEEVSAHLPIFRILSTQLKETASQVENSVVSVCSSFQSIAARARDSVSRAASLFETSKAQKGNHSFYALMEQCSETMEHFLQSLTQTNELSDRSIQRVREIDRSTEKIIESLKKLDEIAEGNKMLALNAQIEAAHAGVHGKGFAIVAQEVSDQAIRSREVISSVQGLSDQLRSLSSSTRADLQQMATQNKKLVEEHRDHITQVLQDLKSVHTELHQALTDMSKESSQLAGDISTAVQGLQFQDRTNQRLSHIIDALESMQEKFSKYCTGLPAQDQHYIDDLLKRYTMEEERQAAGIRSSRVQAGELELF